MFWEHVSISPINDQDGNIINFVAVKDDISAKKELERIKEDVERIMRHDLKSPLNAIIGMPQLLALADNLTEEQQELVSLIEESGKRMLDMVEGSLDLFKMETGSYECEPKPVNALGVMERLAKHCRSKVSAKMLSLATTVDSHRPSPGQTFVFDSEERLLYTLFSNLLLNAIEASPQGERIDIEFNTELKHIVIRNKGVVPVVIRDTFFEKYKTQGKKFGTGLGTYSAKIYSEVMGYGIHMSTSDEDNETCITVSVQTLN